MRLSLDPAEAASLQETGGIDARWISYFKGIDDHHRMIVVETAAGGFHWAIMGPIGVDRMSVHPSPLAVIAIMAGKQAVRDFVAEVLEVAL